MRGLIKATHYYATQQARADWAQLVEYAYANGHGSKVSDFRPSETAGHRMIDRSIDALMAAMGLTMTFAEWQAQQQEAQP